MKLYLKNYYSEDKYLQFYHEANFKEPTIIILYNFGLYKIKLC